MEDFKDTPSFCELSDLGACGPFFTWHNGQEGLSFTQERLDRATSSSDWCFLFLVVDLAVESSLTSYYAPLLIALKGQQSS
jgi:hypothetical protein